MRTSTNRFYIARKVIVGEWIWDNLKCACCLSEIEDGESRLYCPYCGSAAHRDEILEWVKIKSVCPYCNRKLSLNDLTRGG